MSTSPSELLQLGMVNPPRRVKRLRELALKDSPSSSAPLDNPLPSASPSPGPPEASGTPAPRRRGRKPAGPLSKSAREQLRKTNHSVIEKRRREKINEALAALRELVPHEKQDGERKEDKEFKLEVLVRTVEYLRIMVDRVKNLEAALCQKCGGSLLLGTQASPKAALDDVQTHRPVKRMRVEAPDSDSEDVDNDNGSDVHLHTPPYHKQQKLAHASSNPASPRPRLPSISSWISDASFTTVPRALPALDSSPGSHRVSRSGTTSTPGSLPNSQLPSPPQTVPFAPTTIAATGFPPRLVLPSPVGPPIGPSSLASPLVPSPGPLTSLVASPASHPSLTSPAPFACPTFTTSPTFTSLNSPAFAPLRSRGRNLDRDRGRDRDVPDLPLDTDADTEHPHRHMLQSPPSSGHGSSGSGRHTLGGQHTGGRRSSSGQHGSNASRRGSRSQDSSWSRDDQTAASLLLNFSSRRGGGGMGPREEEGQRESRGSGPRQQQQQRRTLPLKDIYTIGGRDTVGNSDNANTPGAPAPSWPGTRTRTRRAGDMLEAQTPSSLLGMGEDSGSGEER